MSEEHTPSTVYETCPICGVSLREPCHMKSYESYVLFVGITTNAFVHRHNTENWGATVKKHMTDADAKPRPAPLPSGELSEAILAAIDNPNDEDARQTAVRALIAQAADIAAKGGAGAMSALGILGDQLGEALGRLKPPEPGERCKLCGRSENVNRVVVSGDMSTEPWQE